MHTKGLKGDRERWPVATHLTILQLILASDMNRQQLLPPPKASVLESSVANWHQSRKKYPVETESWISIKIAPSLLIPRDMLVYLQQENEEYLAF
jgi:hypothetical protein